MRPQGYVANQHSDPVIWILTRIRDMIWMIPKVNHVCSSLYIRNISALKAARGISLSLSLALHHHHQQQHKLSGLHIACVTVFVSS